MNLARVILRVSDMEQSASFWSEAVGLEVKFEAGSFTFLETDGVQLVLHEVVEPPTGASQTELVFEVEDVRASFGQLEDRGVEFEVELRPVTSDGDNDLLASHFRDPDGHLASITGWVVRADPSANL